MCSFRMYMNYLMIKDTIYMIIVIISYENTIKTIQNTNNKFKFKKSKINHNNYKKQLCVI
jgi:hypothetical protein